MRKARGENFKHEHTSESPGGFVKTLYWAAPQNLHSVSLEWDWFCISNKFSGNAGVPGLEILRMAALDKSFTKFKSHMNHMD